MTLSCFRRRFRFGGRRVTLSCFGQRDSPFWCAPRDALLFREARSAVLVGAAWRSLVSAQKQHMFSSGPKPEKNFCCSLSAKTWRARLLRQSQRRQQPSAPPMRRTRGRGARKARTRCQRPPQKGRVSSRVPLGRFPCARPPPGHQRPEVRSQTSLTSASHTTVRVSDGTNKRTGRLRESGARRQSPLAADLPPGRRSTDPGRKVKKSEIRAPRGAQASAPIQDEKPEVRAPR